MLPFLQKHLVHLFAIIAALLLGVCTGLPQLLVLHDPSLQFQGIYKEIHDDQLYYIARASDILDGHTFLSNPYLREHKEANSFHQWIPDYILTLPSQLFGLSLWHSFFVWDFLLPPLLFLVTYLIGVRLTHSPILGLAGAVFLHGILFFDEFSRTPSPQYNFLWVLLLVYATATYVQKQKRIYLYAITLITGLLFYTYFFYWTFALAFLSLALLGKSIKDVRVDFSFLLSALGAIAFGIPYIVQTISLSSLSEYAETMRRLGLIESHIPSGLTVVVVLGSLLLVVLALLFWKRIVLTPTVIIGLSLVGAALAVLNQHLVTGRNLEFSSHYVLPAAFSGVFLSLAVVAGCVWYWRRAALVVLVIAICCGAVYTIAGSIRTQVSVAASDIRMQAYGPIFSWLQSNAMPEEVVVANEEASVLIPAYTKQNVLFSHYATLFLASDGEMEERFLVNHYWDRIDDAFILAANAQREPWGTYYINWYAHEQSTNALRSAIGLSVSALEPVPLEKRMTLIIQAKMLQKQPLAELYKRYNVGYVLWDSERDPYWRPTQEKFLEPVMRSGNLVLYRVFK